LKIKAAIFQEEVLKVRNIAAEVSGEQLQDFISVGLSNSLNSLLHSALNW
jgi:hypothetical protein